MAVGEGGDHLPARRADPGHRPGRAAQRDHWGGRTRRHRAGGEAGPAAPRAEGRDGGRGEGVEGECHRGRGTVAVRPEARGRMVVVVVGSAGRMTRGEWGGRGGERRMRVQGEGCGVWRQLVLRRPPRFKSV